MKKERGYLHRYVYSNHYETIRSDSILDFEDRIQKQQISPYLKNQEVAENSPFVSTFSLCHLLVPECCSFQWFVCQERQATLCRSFLFYLLWPLHQGTIRVPEGSQAPSPYHQHSVLWDGFQPQRSECSRGLCMTPFLPLTSVGLSLSFCDVFLLCGEGDAKQLQGLDRFCMSLSIVSIPRTSSPLLTN